MTAAHKAVRIYNAIPNVLPKGKVFGVIYTRDFYIFVKKRTSFLVLNENRLNFNSLGDYEAKEFIKEGLEYKQVAKIAMVQTIGLGGVFTLCQAYEY